MEQRPKTLSYTIHKYSSYSANYVPENIMVNNPTDQLSRWFTDSTTPSQYVMLKLDRPAIVETIKFGKYTKAHVSDLKKFQIFGGLDENNLSLLLSGGLKKDCEPEIFRLRHRTMEGLYLPVQYIKIVPLQSWGPAHNYTIWFVELHGENYGQFIHKTLDTFYLRKEEEAVRVLLKHLRRRRYKDAFEALSRESGVQLEGPLQARLFNALVENGDYEQAEQILEEAMREGEFDWYMSWQPYSPVWRQMSPCSQRVEAVLCSDTAPATTPPHHQCCGDEHRPEDGLPCPDSNMPYAETSCCDTFETPGPRGGHQLVVDANTGTLYLFGGWNGNEDLDDLWSFNTVTEKWTLLCRNSGKMNGPSPRSCHKMVFDPTHRQLYTLGRYLDNIQRVPANMNSDLYMFDCDSKTWSLVCPDTAVCGGPRLVFDHQMCIDPDTRTVFVFGGRVLPVNTEEAANPQYSGLYAYYIATNTWQQLLPDKHELFAPQPRVSHSMLFHPIERRLYIFAGQRNKEHLLDLWWWDVTTNECGALCCDTARAPPAAGFTQRACLDPHSHEMSVLSGMCKEKDKRVFNSLWIFSLRRQTWSCVYRNDTVSPNEPRPRFAHQLVYDPNTKIHYLFGGNPGNQSSPRLRLDDLWALHLKRPTIESVFNKARASVREACYRELCAKKELVAALSYLRTRVKESVDNGDPQQVAHFHKLPTVLFSGTDTETSEYRLTSRRARTLGRRRADVLPHSDFGLHLAAVLGSDDPIPEPVTPFEDINPPVPESWDVGEDEEEVLSEDLDTTIRTMRLHLYDSLCRYFRPSSVPPAGDITDIVNL